MINKIKEYIAFTLMQIKIAFHMFISKFRLIDNWKQCWKLYSVQVFIVLAFLPEIYTAFASIGLLEAVPTSFDWVLRCLAGIGVITRLIKQRDNDNKKDDDK